MLAKKIRRMIIEASYQARACHIGSALSCVEILIDIDVKMKKDDVFIFSKASGVAAYYCLLSVKGIIPKDKISYYLKNFPLPSREVPGVLVSLGSLGHGLPIATGLALADRNRNVYILMSDAELQEGTTWESLLFKRHHNLDNLKIYVDYNGLQATNYIYKTLKLPISFLKSMGVKMIKTIKGVGVSFLKDKIESHYINLSKSQYEKAIRELSN